MTRISSCFLTTIILIPLTQLCFAQAPMKWKIHDLNRPVAPVVDPGTASTQDAPGRAPSDAVVLFDGKDLSHWVDKDGKPAKWKVENGYMEVVAKTGNISTHDSFGDCQLHVEFAEPSPPSGESQERGNSGVFLMGLYEIQVLDSYQNKTYADGQASAVYGQYPPLVNASRPPAQWQTYDIIFHRPRLQRRQGTSPGARDHSAQRSAGARQRGTHRPNRARRASCRTKRTPTSYRCSCRITAIRCATATFGFANCTKLKVDRAIRRRFSRLRGECVNHGWRLRQIPRNCGA